MKRIGLTTIIGVGIATVVLLSATRGDSRPNYSKEFVSKFVHADSSDPDAKSFAEAAAAAKCSVCHAGDSKKNRNAFGRELAKILHNEKDNSKIDEAFDSVLKMKSDPNDSSSPTYGDLIKQGKLPAAE